MNQQTAAVRPTPELVAALERYLDLLEAGKAPVGDEYALQYPHMADELRSLIKSLEFVHISSTAPKDRRTPGNHVAANLSMDVNRDVSLASAAQDERLGDFRLIREIGRGGMGVVYEAEQISLKRRVAVKVLPFAGLLDAQQRQRFQNEAAAAASLHHSNIVNAFFVGNERGVHFYAMRLVEGQSVATFLEQLRSADQAVSDAAASSGSSAPTGRRWVDATTMAMANQTTAEVRRDEDRYQTVARLVSQAADALHHAHSMGIVHRDVKPSNLLIDAQGSLWVTDFGLAATQSDLSITLTGELLGTLRYMSPEQAEGQTVVDHRTDIYSLGLVLYEMVLLKQPFSGANRAALLKQVVESNPQPPAAVDGAVPRVLESIILKAIAKDPTLRYASAAQLANDLRCFANHEHVTVRRPSRHASLKRWVLRNRALAASLLVLALLLLASVAATTTLTVHYARLAQRESVARIQENANRQQLMSLLHETLDEFGRSIAAYPGLEDVHAKLLARVVQHQESLMGQYPNDVELQFEVGRAHRWLGLVRSQTRARSESVESLRRSETILSHLVAARLHWPESLGELTRTHYGLAYAESPAATKYEHAARAKELAKQWVRIDPSKESRLVLVESLGMLGRQLGFLARWAEAEQTLQQGLVEGRRLLSVEADPATRTTTAELARILGGQYLSRQRFAASEAAFREALDLFPIHHQLDDRPALRLEQLSGIRSGLACVLNRRQCAQQAEQLLNVSIAELLSGDRTGQARRHTHQWLAAFYFERGISHTLRNDGDAAIQAFQESLRRWRIIDSFRSIYVADALSHVLWRENQRQAAEQTLHDALADCRSVNDTHAHARRIKRRVACIYLLTPVPQFADAERGGRLAEELFSEEDGSDWQLLAIAQGKRENWQEAHTAIHHAMRRRNGGDLFDWCLAALVEAKLGHIEMARQWLQRAEAELHTASIDLTNFAVPQQLDQLRDEVRAAIEAAEMDGAALAETSATASAPSPRLDVTRPPTTERSTIR